MVLELSPSTSPSVFDSPNIYFGSTLEKIRNALIPESFHSKFSSNITVANLTNIDIVQSVCDAQLFLHYCVKNDWQMLMTNSENAFLVPGMEMKTGF